MSLVGSMESCLVIVGVSEDSVDGRFSVRVDAFV